VKTAVEDTPAIDLSTPRSAGPVSSHGVSPAGLVLSAVALGCALQVNFGQYHPVAMLWLSVALGGVVASVVAAGHPALRALDDRRPLVLGLALSVQLGLLLTRSPGATGRLATDQGLSAFKAGAIAGIVFASATVALAGRRSGRACLLAMLLIHAALGLWVLRAAPDPGTDVILFQREGAAALVEGRNPYELTFKDPYAGRSRFYGPGVAANGRLHFGYPYPPLSLLLVALGHLAGDVRYAQWLAMTAAGAFVALTRPAAPWAVGAAGVLLFTPRGFFVLEAGWTEPLTVLMLAATVFASCRRQGSAWLPLGLLFATKQYLVLTVLVAPLFTPPTGRRRRVLFASALLVAAAVTLPLVLWNAPAFVHSAVLLQFRQPFRDDALSYSAALANVFGWRPPAWLAFAAVGAAVWLALRKLPRTPAGFAAGAALVFLTFFAFNKQAFCNYYHFVIGALCCAAGAAATVAPPASPDDAISAAKTA
jgi:hypothetical protein